MLGSSILEYLTFESIPASEPLLEPLHRHAARRRSLQVMIESSSHHTPDRTLRYHIPLHLISLPLASVVPVLPIWPMDYLRVFGSVYGGDAHGWREGHAACRGHFTRLDSTLAGLIIIPLPKLLSSGSRLISNLNLHLQSQWLALNAR